MKSKIPWVKKLKYLTRNAKGQFQIWRGGRKLTYHGMQTHIGKDFAKQAGRPARVGDVHRHRNSDGKYMKDAPWHVYTAHGWRRWNHATKPTKAQAYALSRNSRPGVGSD